MRRLTSFAIALAAAMSLSSGAQAAGIFFDVVTTAAITTTTATDNASCPAPCYQVRVFVDDPTGIAEIQSVQFDIKVEGATLVNLIQPGAPLPQPTRNSQGGNVTISPLDGATDPFSLPWNLSTTVGASPVDGFYALIVDASDALWTVNSIKAVRADPNNSCVGTACAPQLAGLDLNRIFLGRFNLSGASASTTFTVNGITGDGGLVVGVAGLSGLNQDGTASFLTELNGASCSLANFATGGSCLIDRPSGVPEPAAALLLGAALAGLSLVRRRS